MVIRLIPATDTIHAALRSCGYCPLLEVFEQFLIKSSWPSFARWRFSPFSIIFDRVGPSFARGFAAFSVFSSRRPAIWACGWKSTRRPLRRSQKSKRAWFCPIRIRCYLREWAIDRPLPLRYSFAFSLFTISEILRKRCVYDYGASVRSLRNQRTPQTHLRVHLFISLHSVASVSPPTPSAFTPIFSRPSFPVSPLFSFSFSAQRPELYHFLVGATQSSVFAQSLLGDAPAMVEAFDVRKPKRSKAKEPTRRRSRKKQPDLPSNALPPSLPTLSNAPTLPSPSTFPLFPRFMQRILAGDFLHRRFTAHFAQIGASAPSRLLSSPFARAFAPSWRLTRLLQAARCQIFVFQTIQTRSWPHFERSVLLFLAQLDQSGWLYRSGSSSQWSGLLTGQLLAVFRKFIEAGIRFDVANGRFIAASSIWFDAASRGGERGWKSSVELV